MNWRQLVCDLISSGYTQIQIGKSLDKSQPYINDILKGRYADLKWSDGEKLIRLHKRVLKKLKRAREIQ